MYKPKKSTDPASQPPAEKTEPTEPAIPDLQHQDKYKKTGDIWD
jgi:hypothetical protein